MIYLAILTTLVLTAAIGSRVPAAARADQRDRVAKATAACAAVGCPGDCPRYHEAILTTV